MTENKDQTIFRKILVAVDTSSHSRAALEAAVTLAKMDEADISGVFVHEKLWKSAHHFSGSSTVNALTGEAETSEADTLQQRIDRLENRLQRQLIRISRQHKINHTWNTKHGRVSDQILEAAKEADLITLGRSGRSLTRKNKLGSTARRVIRKANKPVLILKKGLRLSQTVTVAYNATPESQKGLRMALNLAKKNDGKLSILVTDGREKSKEKRDKTVEKMVEDSDIPVSVDLFHQISVGRFLNAINNQHSGLLVIPKNQSFLRGAALEITLEHIHCPVLLVV